MQSASHRKGNINGNCKCDGKGNSKNQGKKREVVPRLQLWSSKRANRLKHAAMGQKN